MKAVAVIAAAVAAAVDAVVASSGAACLRDFFPKLDFLF